MKRGSITVFSTIALALISATIFTLLEGVRYQELQRMAALQTELSIESALANYNCCLWENYHLLASDYSAAKEIIYKTSNAKTSAKGMNLLSLKSTDVSLEGYTLLTDGNGVAFVNSVSSYMRENLLYETVKELYSRYESVKNIMNSSEMDRSNIDAALENIESLEESADNSTGTSRAARSKSELTARDILETAKQWMEKESLELFVEDAKGLSEAECSFENGLLKRERKEGKNYVIQQTSWTERILLQQYLLTYMSSFNEVKSDRALKYELEYLLGKKESDIKNLEYVIVQILAVREAANFLHLVSNPEKMARAEGLATLLAGASLNPAFIKVVKIGLLTAWALAESILDVRALLAGKRVAFIKSEETWTTDLEDIEAVSKEFVMAKESPWGMEYEDYIGAFLLFERDETLAMRTLQIQEETIRKNSSAEFHGMDSLITHADVSIQYSYEPVFPFLEIIEGLNWRRYQISSRESLGYY